MPKPSPKTGDRNALGHTLGVTTPQAGTGKPAVRRYMNDGSGTGGVELPSLNADVPAPEVGEGREALNTAIKNAADIRRSWLHFGRAEDRPEYAAEAAKVAEFEETVARLDGNWGQVLRINAVLKSLRSQERTGEIQERLDKLRAAQTDLSERFSRSLRTNKEPSPVPSVDYSDLLPAPKYGIGRTRAHSTRGPVPAVAVIVPLTSNALDEIDGISYAPHTVDVWPPRGTDLKPGETREPYVTSYRVTGNVDAVADYASPRGVNITAVAATPEQETALKDHVRYEKMREDLRAGLITPRSVVGTGYKNGRKVAEEYLYAMIASTARRIEKV